MRHPIQPPPFPNPWSAWPRCGRCDLRVHFPGRREVRRTPVFASERLSSFFRRSQTHDDRPRRPSKLTTNVLRSRLQFVIIGTDSEQNRHHYGPLLERFVGAACHRTPNRSISDKSSVASTQGACRDRWPVRGGPCLGQCDLGRPDSRQRSRGDPTTYGDSPTRHSVVTLPIP